MSIFTLYNLIKMRLFKIITLIIIATASSQIMAQLKTEHRVEIELNNGYSNEHIFKSVQGYFVIQSEANKPTQKIKETRYDLYDQALRKVKSTSIYVPEDLKLSIDFNDDNNKLYQLFYNKTGEFILYSLEINLLQIDSVKGKLPKNVVPVNMKIVNAKAWLRALLKKQNCIVQIDMQTGNTLISEQIEKEAGKTAQIINYQFSPVSGELLVFVNKYIKKGVCELSQMTVNKSCELCNQIQLTGTGDKLISSVSGCRTAENEMVYTGTYSRSYAGNSEGVFFAKTINDKMSYIKYTNFLDMKNFMENRSEFTRKLTEKIKTMYKKKGKEYSINYNVITHDIVITPKGYLLIGEVFKPTYMTTQTPVTTYINGMVSTSYRISTTFTGYQYTHAFVAGFSGDGDLVWDQLFEMSPVEKPYTPKQFVRVSEQTDSHITLMYTSGALIASKNINFDGVVEKQTSFDYLKPENANEKSSFTSSGAQYWYDNYFLIYGSQSIRNKEDKSHRKVFYVNKVMF